MPPRCLLSRLKIFLSVQEDALAKILSRLQPAALALTECTSRRFRRLGDCSNVFCSASLVLIALQSLHAQNQLVTRSHFEQPLEATVVQLVYQH